MLQGAGRDGGRDNSKTEPNSARGSNGAEAIEHTRKRKHYTERGASQAGSKKGGSSGSLTRIVDGQRLGY